jgi:hypothetical protein
MEVALISQPRKDIFFIFSKPSDPAHSLGTVDYFTVVKGNGA